MVRVIMHGCNGKMGQTISGLIASDDFKIAKVCQTVKKITQDFIT